MSFGRLLPLLPFYYSENQRDKNVRLLEGLKTICNDNLNQAMYLIEDAFPSIFQKDGFEMFYQEQQRLYQLTLTEARRTGLNINEDKIFMNTTQEVFEKKTEKLAKNNRVAYRMTLSLIRRKDNWVKFGR